MRTVLAVDGGNSKTDVALVGEDGRLIAGARGPTSSHQAIGLEPGMARLSGLVADVLDAGPAGTRPEVAVYALAGADRPDDVRALVAALGSRGFAAANLVRNDTLAALRAGTDRGWGVVVICGSGVNAAGVAPDGRTARLAALGAISGDWGGGTDVGWAGLAAAVRARDGRGPRTRLASDVPAHFGVRSPAAVTSALYTGRVPETRIGELSPAVFAAAAQGDAVARGIVDRLADEVVAMAGAMLRRLRLSRTDPDVVLGGGVFRTTEAGFWDRLTAGIGGIAPAARCVRLATPPVAGAALLALDELTDLGAEAREELGVAVRAGLGVWEAGLRGP